MRGLNPDQLRAFLEVLEMGSFTAASKKLSLSQPAVSLQIRELEAKCGVPLLDRNGRSPSPTAAGRQLAIHARRIMNECDMALAAMQHIKSSALGLVRLGMTVPTLAYLASDAVRTIRTEHAGIDLVMTLSASTRLATAVRDSELDLAIVSLPVDSSGLNSTVVFEEQVVALAPANVVSQGSTVMTPGRLSAAPFYVQGNPDVQLTLASRWFREVGLSPESWFEVDTLEACCAAANAGLGATILPASMAKAVANPALVYELDPPILRQLAVVTRDTYVLSKQAATVRDVVIEGIRSQKKSNCVSRTPVADNVKSSATAAKLRVPSAAHETRSADKHSTSKAE